MSSVSVNGVEPGQTQAFFDQRNLARLDALQFFGKSANMIGRRAATAADDIDEAGLRKFCQQVRHIVGALIVQTKFVGQSRIGIGADERVGNARQFCDMGAQFLGAQSAIQTDRQGVGMAQWHSRKLRVSGPTKCGRTGP